MGKTILFVEDDIELRNTFCTLLERENYLTLPYTTGQGAISNIRYGLKYDLAIVDLILPDGTGEEVIDVSKDINPDVPAIIFSGYLYKPKRADGLIIKSTWKNFLCNITHYLSE